MAKNKLINIRGLDTKIDSDMTFRYKMQPISVTMLRTKSAIVNISEVSQNLNRDPKMLIEFFKKKLGIPMNYNSKDNRVEFKGVVQSELQNATYEFIQYYVLCPGCSNPETILCKKKSKLYIRCKACSYNDEVKTEPKIVSKTIDTITKLVT